MAKDSPIEGRGLYAARDFQNNEVVSTWQTARELSGAVCGNLSPTLTYQ